MHMLNTVDFLLYSCMYDSIHDSRYIHGQWIVRRALNMAKRPKIIYLPMSNDEDHGQDQKHSWEAFKGYFNQYAHLDLNSKAYFWLDKMSKNNADKLFHDLRASEVVILGGGSSHLGMERYSKLGDIFYGDPDLFRISLLERQKNRKLTVGFSAGAEQLCTYLMASIEYDESIEVGFNLAQYIVVAVHYDSSKMDLLQKARKRSPECSILALPNGTGLGISQRVLQNNVICQVIEFIVEPETISNHRDALPQSIPYITHLHPNGEMQRYTNGVQLFRTINSKNAKQNVWLIKGKALV